MVAGVLELTDIGGLDSRILDGGEGTDIRSGREESFGQSHELVGARPELSVALEELLRHWWCR